TGHMVLEETLLSQITSNAAVMPHYEFFHVPGMDWLGRHIDPPTTPLQVASVAQQLGRRRVLSETFALTGWNVSFEELKWMFEWQMVRGVTLLCQHLEGYSLRGIRKRDYPPSLFFQQPWWEEYRAFNDAMSRIGMLLSVGEPCVEVLVVHPQSSAWLDFDQGANRGLRERNEAFLGLTRALEAAHVPFHYGDERILRRHGEVVADRLRVGQCRYAVVVVPPVSTLARETAILLRDFALAGGALVWCGVRHPCLIDGAEDPLAGELAGHGVAVGQAAEVTGALPASVRRLRVLAATGQDDPGRIAVTERSFAGDVGGHVFRMVYLVNSDTAKVVETTVSVPGRSACRFVMETGETVPIAFAADGDGGIALPWRFEPAGSLVLFVSDEPDMWPAAAASAATPRPLAERELAGPWDLDVCDLNALTLDVCDISFDGERIAEREHVSVVQKRALDLGHPVDIALRFEVETVPGWVPPPDCALVLEQPERWTVTVNATRLAGRVSGWYRDTSFRRLELEGTLREGRNEIVLETRFAQSARVYENLRRASAFESEKNKLTYDAEVEAVYLVGPFGVLTPGTAAPLPRGALRYEGPFLLGELPRRVEPGNLTLQGLPFFNGTVRLRRRIELDEDGARCRTFVFRRLAGHVLRLRVNGTEAGRWLWRPFQADLTGLLRPGENLLELELTGGLRNLLGPHHLEEGESYAVAPGSFFKEPNIWGSRPWNDAYCFVDFGVGF
ncbi:MAG: hypothetical protein JXR77_16290, partial [Lentisphaeria bacterium]|nr:hypothetical protein [Lentisphaeria bacterium]